MPDDPAYSIPPERVRLAFERAAPGYDAAAALAREVCERMLGRLDYIRRVPRTVLDLGAGTGYGARRLLDRYPQARVIALDLALHMLEADRRHATWWKRRLGSPRLVHVCASAEALPIASNSVGLVWSNLLLHWCDPDRVLAEAHRVLEPEGLLMFSSLGPDTLKELRGAFAGVDRHVHVHRFTDMHDIGDVLIRLGFADPVMDMEMLTLTYPDVYALLRELKASGAQNLVRGRRAGLMGKAAWRQMLGRYEALRREGRLPATFEVVYGHAWKPRARVAADGRQIVRFHDLKGAGR